MADESDVGNALVALVTAAAYPNGTGQASALGSPATVQRGWPVPKDLDTALKAGRIVISIFGQNGTERNTSRFSLDWQTLAPPVHTLTAAVAGNTVTIGGTIASPQNVAIILGDNPATAKIAIYPVQPSDTLTTIATGLAAILTMAGVTASSSGPVITLPAASIINTRIGGYGTVCRELKRQERSFMITLWCSTPAQRDQASPIIDVALIKPEYLLFADGTVGRLVYERTLILDEKQILQIYRRDIVYRVEYPTIETQAGTEILTNILNVTQKPPG